MKCRFHALAVVVVALTGDAFAQTNAARIYRLVFSEQKVSDAATMYSTQTNLNSRRAILHYLTNGPARLTERDVIIMHVENHGERSEPVTHFRWSLASACKTSGAQLFEFDCSGVVAHRSSGIREMSVFHWKSPYEEPRSPSKTEFYLDEKFMGVGPSGLKAALSRISIQKPRYLAMAWSRYTEYSSYGPFETPFGAMEKEVNACITTNGITEVVLCDARVVAADGKDYYDREQSK